MDISHCLVNIIYEESILLYHYNPLNSSSPVCLQAKNSCLMSQLICKHHSFNQLSHSHYLYLGKELYKAELSLTLNQSYIQS